ncbi:hypothetical protein PACTADRAFT_86331 [Pachysolen tannophilus NRRL Y-2460]|uniref:Ran-interacting Mog1 protein n=1 Tax=Pachysolen tannophilus NRRL Y-2460 TaxID=669874 RepID=A0A1E4TQT2_PACTA|nr:hypothetical protein PACTADRAFT_86331 [Pachysolen tannophilus NRRL Y-2460]
MIFEKHHLYGGAITAELPKNLVDASQLRQIPDTQEVFLVADSNTLNYSELNKDDSIVIDLMERVIVDPGKDDIESIYTHAKEISSLNNNGGENEWKLQKIENFKSQNFPNDNIFTAVCIEPAKKWGRTTKGSNQPTLVILLGLIRIEKISTDLLCTINVPIVSEEELDDLFTLDQGDNENHNKASQRINLASKVLNHFLQSVKIEDWSIFTN